jgi:hypothetical protein
MCGGSYLVAQAAIGESLEHLSKGERQSIHDWLTLLRQNSCAREIMGIASLLFDFDESDWDGLLDVVVGNDDDDKIIDE